MEKKKLLLVAISVGIFLVIAIGAAILVFTPKNTAASAGAAANRSVTTGTDAATVAVGSPSAAMPSADSTPANSSSSDIDPVDLVRNPGGVPGLKTNPDGSYRQDSDYYIVDAPPSAKGKSNETVISVPKPTTAAVPNAAPAARAAPSPKPAPQQAAKSTAPTSAKPAAAKPAAPAKSQTTAKAKVRDDFWVQTGAFSTVTSAEGVKETLASKGIKSVIENRDVNGKTMFRVRVGPYTSKNEADYWLSLIKSINGFEDSQVRQTQSLQ